MHTFLHETLLGVSFIDEYQKEGKKCLTDDDNILSHTLIFLLLRSFLQTLRY